ncbi:MAG: transcription elongation factor GreA, partial [Candidatus Limnocylindrales bacterium]
TRPEVIARVASARQLGDLRENAEYQSAREEQSFLEGRVATLESMPRNARVIEATGAPEVSLGSHVVVESGGETRTFELVGSTEADPVAGRISDRSPVGNALMGKRAGDSVTVRLPAGEVSYRILEVT